MRFCKDGGGGRGQFQVGDSVYSNASAYANVCEDRAGWMNEVLTDAAQVRWVSALGSGDKLRTTRPVRKLMPVDQARL